MANMQTDTNSSRGKKPQTHKQAEDHAEDPSKPSQSRWGARDEGMSSGLDEGAIQPGNSNGASYP